MNDTPSIEFDAIFLRRLTSVRRPAPPVSFIQFLLAMIAITNPRITEHDSREPRLLRTSARCRGAMGIAARPGAQRSAFRLCFSARCAHVGPLQRPSLIFVTAPSGCFSNQHRQPPLRVEIPDGIK